MQEGLFISESSEKRCIKNWLLDPFRYVAGEVALFAGLVFIIASALVGYVVPVHFDGVLDVHFLPAAPLWFFVAEGIIAWLCMALVLHAIGAVLAPSRFRFLDMLGTQALARWPYLVIAIVSVPPSVRRVMKYLEEEVTNAAHTVALTAGDVLVTVTAMSIVMVAIIWSVMLMYKAYAVSTGIREMGRRIISFIVGLIIAEVVSKIVFIAMGVQAGMLPGAPAAQ